MIRLREATALALTKLRTRKVRLAVTVIISGLLFTVLAGASMTARGLFSGIGSLSKEGLGDRYIVSAYGQTAGNFYSDPDVVDRALAIQKEIAVKKKAEAKRLGVEYDTSTDRPPVEEYPGPNGTKFRSLNDSHPAARQAIREYLAAHPYPALNELRTEAKPYNPKGYFESRSIPYNLGGARLQVMKDGQEDHEGLPGDDRRTGSGTGIDSFASSWTAISKELMQPFILPGQNLDLADDGSVPVIVPLGAAEQLLKLKKLPATASTEEQIERTKEIRSKVAKLTFEVCYRNQSSAEYIEQAITAQKEIDQNKNKKDYVRPDLQYGLPTEPCGATPVVRDVRTKEQKTKDANQATFDQLFGKQAAAQEIMKFRIVGLVPDPEYTFSTNVTQIVRSLVTSSLGNGWYTPLDLVKQDPTMSGLFFDPLLSTTTTPVYYVELSSATQARRFIDKENCSPNFSVEYDGSKGDPMEECKKQNNLFTISTYGSNSLGMESAKRGFSKIFFIASAIVALIACIIMMGTVGKMIADSRRETAVFRAIGAKKLDIAQIYLLYAIFISILVTIFAMVVGFLAALWADSRWAGEITQEAVVAYNAQDLGRQIRLYSFYPMDMLYILGIAVGAGMLSAIIPLVRSLRRNPIRDMRDDT